MRTHKTGRALLWVMIVTVISFGLIGCQHSEHPEGEHPTKEHPAQKEAPNEHPEGEHPAGEHPAGEHPAKK